MVKGYSMHLAGGTLMIILKIKGNQPMKNNVGTKMPRQSLGCKITSHISTECLDRKMCYITSRTARVLTSSQDWKVELMVVCFHEGSYG